jgi:hypothetical protein
MASRSVPPEMSLSATPTATADHTATHVRAAPTAASRSLGSVDGCYYELHSAGQGKPLVKVVPDEHWPSVWRMLWPDGQLSDMANLTRIKDAAVNICRPLVPGNNRLRLHWKKTRSCPEETHSPPGRIASPRSGTIPHADYTVTKPTNGDSMIEFKDTHRGADLSGKQPRGDGSKAQELYRRVAAAVPRATEPKINPGAGGAAEMRRLEVLGARFGKLVVVGDAPRTSVGRNVVASCDCGSREKVIPLRNLRRGYTKSCGCVPRVVKKRKHGDARKGQKTVEYQAWRGMKQRCCNERHPRFKEWGGRGIKICDRWLSYDAFLADMGRRPSSEHSIDRIDNSGGYEPGNCRWATRSEQSFNRSFPPGATGLRGVRRVRGRFVAVIGERYLGRFDTAKEAHAIYSTNNNLRKLIGLAEKVGTSIQ